MRSMRKTSRENQIEMKESQKDKHHHKNKVTSVAFFIAKNQGLPQVALFNAGHRKTRKDAVHIIK